MLVSRILLTLVAFVVFFGCAHQSPARRTANPTERNVTQDRQTWLQMFARGYFPGRSGQLMFVPHRGDFLVDEDPLYQFMHGSPWPYDARVPLLFHGRGHITQGSFSEAVVQQDIVPTLAAVLRTAPPVTTTGRALTSALRNSASLPKVIALFVIDGMRADYFETYAAQLPTLSRLRQEGAWFTNAAANSMPTATSIGHATIRTGTDPRVHGLVVNQLFNRVTGKPQEAYSGLDPGELMALTLADVWNLATDGQAIIIGQGGAIRATAGLVGHGACQINGRRVLTASYSTRDARWETNDRCYAMPAALANLHGERYWQDAGGSWMGHPIASARTLRASAVFQRFEGDALAAVLESEAVGADEITDMVLINIKSPDYVSHAYGPASAEMRETMAELDRQLARAVSILQRKAGADRLVIAVTADHGMPDEPESSDLPGPAGNNKSSAGAGNSATSLPGPGFSPGNQRRGRIRIDDVVAALDARFAKGGQSIVHYFGDPANAQLHMNDRRLQELGISLADVAVYLEAEFFAAVFTEAQVRDAQSRLPLGR